MASCTRSTNPSNPKARQRKRSSETIPENGLRKLPADTIARSKKLLALCQEALDRSRQILQRSADIQQQSDKLLSELNRHDAPSALR